MRAPQAADPNPYTNSGSRAALQDWTTHFSHHTNHINSLNIIGETRQQHSRRFRPTRRLTGSYDLPACPYPRRIRLYGPCIAPEQGAAPPSHLMKAECCDACMIDIIIMNLRDMRY